MARRLALAASLAALTLALPALAHAATYCVNDGSCAGVNESDLTTALSAAMATTSQADVIQVGDPGTPPTSGWVYSDSGDSANQVQIIGEGPANTVLAGPSTASNVLVVVAAGSSITGLTVQIPNANSSGIVTSGSLSNVDVTSVDDGSHSQTGVTLLGNGGSEQWTGGAITLPTTTSGSYFALVHNGGGVPTTIDLEDLTLTAETVGLVSSAGDDITLRRGAIVAGVGVVNQGAHLTLDDVAFRATPSPTPGLFLITDPSGPNDATSDVNHATAFGNATNGSIGLLANDSMNRSTTVNVRNSIVRNFFYTINRTASSSGGSANVNVSYSDIDLVHKLDETTGSATGATNVGAGMIDSDPLFTNPSAGDFSLKPGSPAIEAGDPAGLLSGDSATDILGAPRISGARQDMGAVELQVPPPAAPPATPTPPAKDRLAPKLKLSKLSKSVKLKRLLKGIKFTVTTSEPSAIDATLAGSARSVKLARHFDYTLGHKHLGLKSGKRLITLKVRRKVLGHSRRFTLRLTIVAADAAGNKTTVRRTIKVR